MAWTEEQREAIECTDRNLLVAAAAGSGKTSVLVERIIKRILVDNIDVDKLLIVTFTRAAATEMRERIYSAIQSKLTEEKDSERLLEQQALLSKSYITTIDAFCQSVVKSNFIESGIDSSYRVADESEMLLVKEEVIEEVLEKWYGKKDPYFINLVETYGNSKTDEELKNLILDINRFINSFPWPTAWLDEQKRIFNPKYIKDFGDTQWGKDALAYLRVSLEGILNEIHRIKKQAEESGIKGYLATLNEDAMLIENAYKCCQSGGWDASYEALQSVSFSTIGRVKKDEDKDEAEKIKDTRTNIKKSYNELVKDIFGGYKEAALEDIELIYKDMRRLINLVKYFNKKLLIAKHDKKIMDFSDIEHIALNVLASKDEKGNVIPTNTALRYQDKFEEIYIDEYQDTNLTQDLILGIISRGNNLFHVGDVKQSIYGFRQARPDLFMNKYTQYENSSQNDRLIRLYKNFRSRRDIVGSVNYIFSRIMNSITAEMDYTEKEYLNYGAEYYNEEYNNPCEMHLVTDTESKDVVVAEAQMISNRIKELISDNFTVYDKNTSGNRPCMYKDIVILMRQLAGKAEIYRQILLKDGIPVYYEGKGGFFTSIEINVVLCFLRIIDNPLQDIPLITVIRSQMFNFSDTEIALIRIIKKDVLFYEACLEYLDKGNLPELKEKIQIFIDKLNEFRDKSIIYNTSELVWEIISKTGYYTYVGLLQEGEKKQANLRLLFDKAASYDNGSNKGIFRFLNYIENLKKKKSDMAEAAAINEGMNVVRIMSIHKSKGLEFPIVFLSNTAQTFSKSDVTEKLVKHKTLGLGPLCYDIRRNVIYPSVIKKIITRRIKNDMKAEEMRILYVAITRAREKLIITGCIKEDRDKYIETNKQKCDFESHRPVNFNIIEAGSMLDWISMSLAYYAETIKKDCNWNFYYHTSEEIFNSVQLNIFTEKPDNKIIIEKEYDEGICNKVKSIFDWEYPYPMHSKIPAKLSVSEVKRLYDADTEEDYESLYKKEVSMNDLPDFLDRKKEDISAALKGTLLHACIQQLDFTYLKNIKEKEKIRQYVKQLIEEMVQKEFFTKLQSHAIDNELIVSFIMSDFARRIMNSDNYMREVPFTIVKEWGKVYSNDVKSKEPVAIQGIIDCYFEENGELVVVDFKSDYVNNVDDDTIKRRYRTQIECYSEALIKITGKNVKHSYIYLLRNGMLLSM